jgi:hypothetical protein
LDEDEHQVGLQKDRLAMAETRSKAAEEELAKLRSELFKLTAEHQTATREVFETRD